jgi:hypothetical protein
MEKRMHRMDKKRVMNLQIKVKKMMICGILANYLRKLKRP